MQRPTRLSAWLILASLVSAAAVAVVCGVALVSLRGVYRFTASVVARHLALLNDTTAFEDVLYHRGYAAEYMLTGDRQLLRLLDRNRHAFAGWLGRAREGARSPAARRLLEKIQRDYADYHATRRRAIALFDAGDRQGAQALLLATHAQIERVLKSFGAFNALGHQQAEATLADAERSNHRLGWLIALTSLLAVLASLAAGVFLAQRVARPIYELQLQVASAAERMRIEVRPQQGSLEGLASHVAGLVQRLEDQDATLVEQRRRLMQSEKLSAVGEIATKLAHEVLNPLAGMKAAAQVLARDAEEGSTVDSATVRETAQALDREIGRVSDLVRRLVDYSRPLAPRPERCSTRRVLDDAVEAAQLVLRRHRSRLERCEEPGLPPLEVDPLLIGQALCNLLCNAAQAMPGGGTLTVSARRSSPQGRDGAQRSRRPGTGRAVQATHLPRAAHLSPAGLDGAASGGRPHPGRHQPRPRGHGGPAQLS